MRKYTLVEIIEILSKSEPFCKSHKVNGETDKQREEFIKDNWTTSYIYECWDWAND